VEALTVEMSAAAAITAHNPAAHLQIFLEPFI
jgi:hypothetical protein